MQLLRFKEVPHTNNRHVYIAVTQHTLAPQRQDYCPVVVVFFAPVVIAKR